VVESFGTVPAPPGEPALGETVSGERPDRVSGVMAAQAPTRVQTLAGRYVVEEELGRGGTGVVYRVLDQVAQRTVALKLLDGAGMSSPSWRERLFREVRYGRTVVHPHVRRVHDVFNTEGRFFVTMEYASGGSLRELLGAAASERPWSDRLADARAVVAGLAAIHAAGLVHGDLKPENVLRMGDGRLVISDFGLSRALDRMTARTGAGGTPGYLAPELARGEAVSQAADVWSLGVVLHEIFFGVRPVWEDSGGGARPRVGGGVRLRGTEGAAARLCAACLADSPAARPSSARALIELLEDLIEPKRARGRRVAWGIAATLGVMIAVAVVVGGGKMLGRERSDPKGTMVGTAADWSNAQVLLETPTGPNCLVALPPDRRKVRVINTFAREALDIDVRTGHSSPSSILPDTYQWGCPQTSPDGRSLLFTTRQGVENLIMFSSHPNGSDAVRVTEGIFPVWLPSGREFLFAAGRTRLARGNLEGERVLFPASSVPPNQITYITPDRKGERVFAVFGWRFGRYSLEGYDLRSLRHLESIPIASSGTPMGVSFDPARSTFQLSIQEQDSYVWVEALTSGQLLRLGRSSSLMGVIRAVHAEAGLIIQSTEGDYPEMVLSLSDGTTRPVARRASHPRVSSQGDVVFISHLPDGRRVIGLRRLQDADARLLTAGPMDRNPSTNGVTEGLAGGRRPRVSGAGPLTPPPCTAPGGSATAVGG
jgi:serine/threonine protein kinase